MKRLCRIFFVFALVANSLYDSIHSLEQGPKAIEKAKQHLNDLRVSLGKGEVSQAQEHASKTVQALSAAASAAFNVNDKTEKTLAKIETIKKSLKDIEQNASKADDIVVRAQQIAKNAQEAQKGGDIASLQIGVDSIIGELIELSAILKNLKKNVTDAHERSGKVYEDFEDRSFFQGWFQ